jgi:hypothetical protein
MGCQRRGEKITGVGIDDDVKLAPCAAWQSALSS